MKKYMRGVHQVKSWVLEVLDFYWVTPFNFKNSTTSLQGLDTKRQHINGIWFSDVNFYHCCCNHHILPQSVLEEVLLHLLFWTVSHILCLHGALEKKFSIKFIDQYVLCNPHPVFWNTFLHFHNSPFCFVVVSNHSSVWLHDLFEHERNTTLFTDY